MTTIAKILSVEQCEPPNEDEVTVRFRKVCYLPKPAWDFLFDSKIYDPPDTPRGEIEDVNEAIVPSERVNNFIVVEGELFASVTYLGGYRLHRPRHRRFWFWKKDIDKLPKEVLFQYTDKERDTRTETAEYWDHKIELQVTEKGNEHRDTVSEYQIVLISHAPNGTMSGARSKTVSNKLLVDETIDDMLVGVIMEIRNYEGISGDSPGISWQSGASIRLTDRWASNEELTLSDRIDEVSK